MSTNVPSTVQPVYEAIIALTDRVCSDLLDDEYAELARRMTAKLARKRPSPLLQGTVPVWACSIIYALGQVNFLFDKSNTPYLAPDQLAAAFGVSSRTASTKAKQILDMLKVAIMDPEWTKPSLMEANPMVWMAQLSNGMIIDLRDAPRELQEEAFEKGMIPYIPADRKDGD